MEEREDTSPVARETAASEAPRAPAQPRWKKYRWALLAGVVALIALLVTIVVLFWPKPQASQTTTTTSTAEKSTTKVKDTAAEPTNSWKSSVDPTALPLGDGKVSTAPQVGYVDSCSTSFRGGGAMHAGDWINTSTGTWNSQTKVAVSGSVNWPSAKYNTTVSGSNRVITTNDLPQSDPTGTFPIGRTDPAYQFDRNPNSIGTQNITLTLPLNPTPAATPSCTSLGYIGVFTNGVLLFNSLDDAGRDAVAHETQDSCDGHPDGQDRYHYHSIARCVRDRATGTSTLVAYALDGYGIYVERDAKGNLPTNADLDECHGRTSEVMWDGKLTNIYHYSATLEYPYTVGCFHGTPATTPQGRP